MGKRTVSCHVCDYAEKLKDTVPDPAICPACGTDLTHPEGETLQRDILCDYVKSFMGVWPGHLYLTNTRLFWIKGNTSAMAAGGGLVGAMVAGAMNKNAGVAEINIPLGELRDVEDFRKGVRSGITINTKSGESFSLLSGKIKEWKELLGNYIK